MMIINNDDDDNDDDDDVLEELLCPKVIDVWHLLELLRELHGG